ncbi:MAG: beta-N-acetylhexosaminidase [Roseburia sp.]|nr:beta-N-acetylhexosaminidase [Roseburia sp.]
MENNLGFKRFGTMLDCSRNAVMSVNSLKKWIDITTDLGYNTLLLYTEDTYEVDDNPYFGYMRGRYTQEELKEVDAYAASKGMELIPCIQTLAHLNAIVRWPAYRSHVDTNDILLAGDEAVYELIDKMFASISKCFTSRTINIGMDEAHMIGRGKYYDLHGDTDRSQILIDHIKRVSEIGKKYGFTLAMWSDMFFRLVAGDNYYDSSAKINEEIKKQIPDNVQLIYWDYYSTDKKRYDKMLTAHEKMKEDTWFAGGLWTWTGLAPHNGYSMKATAAALKSCREHGVQDVFLTMWGDNGGECSKFALLPSLFYASEIAKGNMNKTDIKAKFKAKYGIDFDRFMLLDLPGTPGGAADKTCNAEKYLLYNDCFMGLLDSTISGGENEKYAKCARRLGLLKKDENWGYLFAAEQALCEVLAIKAELGVKTRQVYAGKDKEALKALIGDYKRLQKKLEVFYQAYKKQWFAENKPHGFDVQDARIGGLMIRVRSCAERLQELYDGKIEMIEELEEKQLDIYGNGEEFGHEHRCYNNWAQTITANVV